ncbi:MAG: endonuclease/exonuclease/phosphatase family protein [Alphaproteobacteria bacterium]|nr:endonuclease/exonuclease/phosphatase family protein [Alphaproteobacteria bacterium]
MGYLSKRKFEEREHYLVTGLVFFIPVLTLLSTLGRSLSWRLDYLGEFKMQVACLSLLLFFLCLSKQSWGKMLVFLACALLNLALMASHSHLTQKKSDLPEDSHVFTVLYQNMKGSEHSSDQVRNMMENVHADLVMWTNVPVEIYRRLEDVIGSYQLQNQTLDTTGKMKLIFARTPGVDRGETIGEESLWVSRVVETRKLTLLLAFFDDPWNEKNYALTKQKVFELAEFARGRDEPVVLIGNLGASAWSWLLNDLENYAGLKPQGKLLASGTDKPFYSRRPTDHIYTHPGIETADIATHNWLNTGHDAITAVFKIAPLRKKIEFFELQPILDEEELLQPPT